MERFIDLGNGWFLYEEDRFTVVCDAMSSDPDYIFGAAAWAGRPGPASGRTLLKAYAVRQGQWQQTGPKDWKWFSAEGDEFDEVPASWPRRLALPDGLARTGYDSLVNIVNRVVETESELVGMLQQIARDLPARTLPLRSASARLAFARFTHPHIFGEIEAPATTQ